jgi:D-threo-aldose 1-dehydrogenase
MVVSAACDSRPVWTRDAVTDVSPEISKFVFGGAQLGGLFRAVDDATADAALEAAWEHGVRRFDTAPHYGAGLCERRFGRFLRQLPRDSFTLSTKVGRLLVPTDDDAEGVEGFYGGDPMRRVRDYTADGVRRSLEQSLERLGLDRVDIALIHDPEDHLKVAIEQACPALVELREQGVIGSVGAGMNYSDPLTRFVRETDVDVIMVAGRYTLLDRSAADELLPACRAAGVDVIAAGVFNSGVLAAPGAGATYDYGPAPAPIVARAEQITALCTQYGVPLRAAAIQFALRGEAVRWVAVGVRTAQQLVDNLRNLELEIPAELWARIAALPSPLTSDPSTA